MRSTWQLTRSIAGAPTLTRHANFSQSQVDQGGCCDEYEVPQRQHRDPSRGASGVAGSSVPTATIDSAAIVSVRLGRLRSGFPIVLITNSTSVCVASDVRTVRRESHRRFGRRQPSTQDRIGQLLRCRRQADRLSGHAAHAIRAAIAATDAAIVQELSTHQARSRTSPRPMSNANTTHHATRRRAGLAI